MKIKQLYTCQSCGYETPKWYGKCPTCEGWNTFEQREVETNPFEDTKKNAAIADGLQDSYYSLSQVDLHSEVRFKTGSAELDRVLGGGLVQGSVVLLGGDPGIGKSTLLLQICNCLGEKSTVFYISGEESMRQIKLRAMRLNVKNERIFLISSINIERILNTIEAQKPNIVMIDSIQTMQIEKIKSSPGSVMQVKESTNALMRVAKNLDIPIIIVGHVNKDGAIAGPKVLEHIVDAVLHFEGERNHNFRILRAVKNRFGSTNEIGVFEMQDIGLKDVPNPSQVLIAGRPEDTTGTCISCGVEGTRPILAEVQALVSKTVYGMPRRTATGFDYNRLGLLLAVLEKRCGYFFSALDVYVNVVGGLKLDEPAADLSVGVSLISSLLDKPIPSDIVVFGEIGLTGEIRMVSNPMLRLQEAKRLGFLRCVLPSQSLSQLDDKMLTGIKPIGAAYFKEVIQAIFK